MTLKRIALRIIETRIETQKKVYDFIKNDSKVKNIPNYLYLVKDEIDFLKKLKDLVERV